MGDETTFNPESTQIPEGKRELIDRALKEFDSITEDTRKVKSREQELIEKVRLGVGRVHSDATNARPRDFGHRGVNEVAAQALPSVRSKLLNVEENLQKLGVEHGFTRSQIEGLLRTITTSTIFSQADQAAEQAIQAFVSTVKNAKDQREKDSQQRRTIQTTTEAQAQQGRSMYTRAEQSLGPKNAQESVVFSFMRNSRNLAQTVVDGNQMMHSTDQQFIESNQRHQTNFIQIVNALLGPKPQQKI